MGHDDILNTKIQKDLQNFAWNRPREYIERKKMNQIMKVLMSFQNDGLHHGQIADHIGIDRKTLRPYMKRLLSMGLATREEGKHGKYFPAIKSHRGINLSADILAESFKERILNPYNKELVLDSPYFKRRIPYLEFELEDALFNFSNIIGGWITYILIQSMNPVNKFTNHMKDITEKNLSVETFVEDAISLIQPYILSFFNYYINPFLETLYERVRNLEGGFSDTKNIDKVFLSDFFYNRRLFVLDEDIASELSNAFSNLYPNLNYELEKMRLELPALVKDQIDKGNRYVEGIRRQKACQPHEYIKDADDYDGFYISQCKRCGKTKREEK